VTLKALWRAFVDSLIDYYEKVSSSKKKPNSRQEKPDAKTVPYFRPKSPKSPKSIPYLWPKWLKNHTVWGRTYPAYIAHIREYPPDWDAPLSTKVASSAHYGKGEEQNCCGYKNVLGVAVPVPRTICTVPETATKFSCSFFYVTGVQYSTCL